MTSWVEISEERLRSNFKILVAAAEGKAAVLAVVKANAYGHGVVRCARVLAAARAEWLGVTGVEEGRLVRKSLAAAGLVPEKQPAVLVMCGISEEDAAGILADGLTPVVWRRDQVEWLATAAARVPRSGVVPVHVEVDSGMTRQGARIGAELGAVLGAIREMKEVSLGGVMTHFASAEVVGSQQTVEQKRVFETAVKQVAEAGFAPAWVHAGNTSGVDLEDGPEGLVDWVARVAREVGGRAMVRVGLGLYGYCTEADQDGGELGASTPARRLKPVMTWKARLISLEEVSAGAAVGYNGTFVADRPMLLALVAVGYADGLRRELSSTNDRGGGWVMVRGQRAAVVGRVSMNLTTVDVSGIPGVSVGDEVMLLGEGISAQDHARVAGTIAYEILCGVRAVETEDVRSKV